MIAGLPQAARSLTAAAALLAPTAPAPAVLRPRPARLFGYDLRARSGTSVPGETAADGWMPSA